MDPGKLESSFRPQVEQARTLITSDRIMNLFKRRGEEGPCFYLALAGAYTQLHPDKIISRNYEKLVLHKPDLGVKPDQYSDRIKEFKNLLEIKINELQIIGSEDPYWQLPDEEIRKRFNLDVEVKVSRIEEFHALEVNLDHDRTMIVSMSKNIRGPGHSIHLGEFGGITGLGGRHEFDRYWGDYNPRFVFVMEKETADKQKMCEIGVKSANDTLKSEFGPFVNNETLFDDIKIAILPHDDFVREMPIRLPGYEDTIGYRTYKGIIALDRDGIESSDHAFEVVLHELIEEFSAKFGGNLRSFNRLHEGVIQYFVRKITNHQKRQYYLSAYEDIADIVAKLIQMGVPEELWKRTLVNNETIAQLMKTTNKILGREQGFREIDWALDENDWSKINQLLS